MLPDYYSIGSFMLIFGIQVLMSHQTKGKKKTHKSHPGNATLLPFTHKLMKLNVLIDKTKGQLKKVIIIIICGLILRAKSPF